MLNAVLGLAVVGLWSDAGSAQPLTGLVSAAFPDAVLGVSLKKDLDSRMVWVSAPGASPLEKLRKGLGAWRYSLSVEGGRPIIRPMVQERRTAAASELEHRIAVIKRVLAEAKDSLPSGPDGYESALLRGYNEGFWRESPNPVTSFHIDVLKEVGASQLARIPLYDSQVWATDPTLAESPLPPRLDRAASEMRSLTKALSLRLSTWDPRAYQQSSDIWTPLLAANGEFGQAVVTVGRYRGATVSALRLFDAEGKLIAQDVRTIPIPTPPGRPIQAVQAPLELPAENRLAAAAVSRGAEVSSEAAAQILRLIKTEDGSVEPHLLATVPLLSEFSRKTGLRMALPLTDGLFTDVLRTLPGSTGDLVGLLNGASINLELDEKENWLTGTLALESLSDSLSIERESLNRWLQRGPLASLAWLRSVSLLAAENPVAFRISPLDDWLQATILDPFRPRPVRSILTEPDLLQVMGSMSDSQWDRFVQGEPLPLVRGSFPFAAVSRLIARSSELESQNGSPLKDIEAVASKSLPSGLPLGSSLTLSLVREEALLKKDERIPRSLLSVAQELAAGLESLNALEDRGARGIVGTLGFTTAPEITVKLGSVLQQKLRTFLEDFTPTQSDASFEAWPKEAKDLFLAQVRRAYADKGLLQGSGRPPE